MPGRPAAALPLLAGILLASCSGVPPDITLSRDDRRPAPSDPATGPAVATLEIGGTAFNLHNEGEGCLAVVVSHPGLEATVERRCFAGEHVLEATSSCGWLVAPGEPSPGGCDVDLPRAFYGRITSPGVGYACVGTFRDLGEDPTVVSARFVPFGDDGFILDLAGPDESAHAYLFNRGGPRYGQPPLDAPSGPIYQFCEAQAPWASLEPAYEVNLRIETAEQLRSDALTLSLDGGLGWISLSGGAVESGGIVEFSLQVPESSPGPDLRLTSAARTVLQAFLPWPTELVAFFEGGGTRTGIVLGLTVGADALEGAVDAAAPAGLTATCRV